MDSDGGVQLRAWRGRGRDERFEHRHGDQWIPMLPGDTQTIGSPDGAERDATPYICDECDYTISEESEA